MVKRGQETDSEKYGMVAAALIDNKGKTVQALNYLNPDGHRTHAERAAIERYESAYGDTPKGSVIVSTLSPCSKHMVDREGTSCTDLLNRMGIKKVFCGYLDPSQMDSCEKKREFDITETDEAELRDQCKEFADTFL
jgi:pyrimidine deaminase RibD-like protein